MRSRQRRAGPLAQASGMARSRDHATISAPRNRPGGGRSARCAVAERMGKQVRVSISDFSPDFSVTEIKTMSLTSPHLPAEAGAGYSSGCCALLPYRNLLPTPKFQVASVYQLCVSWGFNVLQKPSAPKTTIFINHLSKLRPGGV